jgi:hypothetical protein
VSFHNDEITVELILNNLKGWNWDPQDKFLFFLPLALHLSKLRQRNAPGFHSVREGKPPVREHK